MTHLLCRRCDWFKALVWTWVILYINSLFHPTNTSTKQHHTTLRQQAGTSRIDHTLKESLRLEGIDGFVGQAVNGSLFRPPERPYLPEITLSQWLPQFPVPRPVATSKVVLPKDLKSSKSRSISPEFWQFRCKSSPEFYRNRSPIESL